MSADSKSHPLLSDTPSMVALTSFLSPALQDSKHFGVLGLEFHLILLLELQMEPRDVYPSESANPET